MTDKELQNTEDCPHLFREVILCIAAGVAVALLVIAGICKVMELVHANVID